MSRSDPQQFARARDLHSSGRDEEAKTAYLAVLAEDPTHLEALTNLGTLLYNNGYRRAAVVAYRQAVAAHPGDLTARVNLANALAAYVDAASARAHYAAALAIDPLCALAHHGLAGVLESLGDPRAAEHRRLGLARDPTLRMPYRGRGPAVPILVLMSARGGNVDTGRFFDDRVYAVTRLFVDECDAAIALPAHRLIFNAIGDADLCADALQRAARLIARSDAPVVNAAAAVASSGRVENARRLRTIDGVVTARTQAYARTDLLGADAARRLSADGFAFPLLVRALGFHTGQHFTYVAAAEQLAAAVAVLPDASVAVIEFVDTRTPDGSFRKYRVMIVDGRLYPLHLAIASTWKVHYLTADMAAQPAARAEEARFLNDLAGALGRGRMRALRAVADALALDYGGIDFGIDARGRVVVFEANATMLVPPPNPQPPWEYRGGAIERIHDAVVAMLVQRIG